ncbi:hypothetical protein CAC42_1692 [Sphaceloma murrayae]|uniref:Radical SAM core domain-containing protein n=1 Tax=Sphaceloma murrayae TaxID=2082308 RepID=A0A2K1QIE2_9PEZI|nr:hypothetical protein CAC42_1692 [Sphaceloma murrayae]
MLRDLLQSAYHCLPVQVVVAVLTAAIIVIPVFKSHLNLVGYITPPTRPISVNYHFIRQCNKVCGFCFHTALTSHRETSANAKAALKLLAEAGMRKVNFAGGEPFLAATFLGEMVDYAKQTLGLESVSIVSNGSLITEKWMRQHAHNLDILAISCDSFNEQTNIAIGRGSGDNVIKLYQIKEWCLKYGVKFKINTVVCALNKDEDMSFHIDRLRPFRWKCFQVLMVKGEMTDKPLTEMSIASSSLTATTRNRDGKQPSGSILDIGVAKALESAYWDQESFAERGGVFDWSREERGCGGEEKADELEW